MPQSSFFDLDNRYDKLNQKDPLIHLNQTIDWEAFRETLESSRKKSRKNASGRKPYDVVLMFKMMVLQHLYNLSDDETEFQTRDRYSFCRFLGLTPEDDIPDAKTLWLFRETLKKKNLMVDLFHDFDQQILAQGFKARKGQIVDASFVDVPKQRNSKEDNDQIKSGKTPERFKENKHRESQKDVEARWAVKNKETHYGYKNHIAIDQQYKLIRDYEVTSAEVHDSQVFIELLSADNSSPEVWADSAYSSEELEISLYAMGKRSQVHQKGCRNHPLTKAQKTLNQKKSKVRARVEHVFGSITNEQGGIFSRVIGMARNRMKIGMMNLVYNMRRFSYLQRKHC